MDTEIDKSGADAGTGGAGQSTPNVGSDAARPEGVFYKLDTRRFSTRELRKAMPKAEVPGAWVTTRVFRGQIGASLSEPAVETLAPFRVSELRITPQIRAKFDERVTELTALGFQGPMFRAVDDYLQQTGNDTATLWHPTLPIVARVHLWVWAGRHPPSAGLFVEFITERPDGTFAWTISRGGFADVPAASGLERHALENVAALLEVHTGRIERFLAVATPARTREEASAIEERLHRLVTTFRLKRGVYVAATPDDMRRAASVERAYKQAGKEGLKNPAVIAEIDNLLNARTGWANQLVLLGVTIVLFVVVGMPGEKSLLRVLSLVPILLFHELGHLLAMKACGYRNVRMFFIPGFGAAVMGRSFNVPAWKHVFVSLMGPVPGIVVGIIVGLCGLAFKNRLALDAGGLLVFLNGFNLIPILPFDGGQVMHTLVFSRHVALEIIFRVGATAAMAAVAVFTPVRVFFFVALAMMLALPQTIRTARVSQVLRKEGFDPVSDDNQSVPPLAADRIVEKLRAASKKPLPNKVAAAQALQVFETLNTRRTGWLSGLGLGMAYGANLVAAVVFTGVFFMARQGRIGEMIRPSDLPKLPLAASGIRVIPGRSRAAVTDEASVTVVATFAREELAKKAYDHAVATAGGDDSIALLGETVLVRIPASNDGLRTRWLDELSGGAAETFVDSPEMHASFRFVGTAATESAAEAVLQEMHDYFQLPVSAGLIAPWSPRTSPTAAQQMARKTFAELRAFTSYDNPEADALREKIAEARRRGDSAQAKSLAKQMAELSRSLRLKHIDRIAGSDPVMRDVDLAKEYRALFEQSKPDEFAGAANKAFAERLGLSNGAGAGHSFIDRTYATRGWTRRAGVFVRVDGVEFKDPTEGAAAMVKWLESRGLTRLRYDVKGYDADDDGDS